MENKESSKEKTLTQDEINCILSENNIVIPASLLFFYIQLTDVVSGRGAIKPAEMASVGRNYNYSSSLIRNLVHSKTQELPSEDNITGKLKKKKKKKQINI